MIASFSQPREGSPLLPLTGSSPNMCSCGASNSLRRSPRFHSRSEDVQIQRLHTQNLARILDTHLSSSPHAVPAGLPSSFLTNSPSVCWMPPQTASVPQGTEAASCQALLKLLTHKIMRYHKMVIIFNH